jgi:ribonucleotide monophosphatase NagD (HAD superfamily)
LSDISAQYDAVLCDLWGCLHNGLEAFPSAVAALQAYRARGGKVVLLTNAPRPDIFIAEQLDTMGVPRDA